MKKRKNAKKASGIFLITKKNNCLCRDFLHEWKSSQMKRIQSDLFTRGVYLTSKQAKRRG